MSDRVICSYCGKVIWVSPCRTRKYSNHFCNNACRTAYLRNGKAALEVKA